MNGAQFHLARITLLQAEKGLLVGRPFGSDGGGWASYWNWNQLTLAMLALLPMPLKTT